MEDIQVIDNFLSQDELRKAKSLVNTHTSWYIQKDSNNENFKGWYRNLMNDAFFYENVFKKIQKVFKKDFKILDVCANAETFGLDKPYQFDVCDYTFILYINDINDKNINDIGGYTLLKRDNGTMCIEPFTNRGLLFKSGISYQENTPFKTSNALRVSIKFKLKML